MQDAFAVGGFLLDGRGALARHCQGLRVNRDIVGQQRRQTQRTQPVVGAFRGQPGIIRLGFIEADSIERNHAGVLAPQIVGDGEIGEAATIALLPAAHAALAGVEDFGASVGTGVSRLCQVGKGHESYGRPSLMPKLVWRLREVLATK